MLNILFIFFSFIHNIHSLTNPFLSGALSKKIPVRWWKPLKEFLSAILSCQEHIFALLSFSLIAPCAGSHRWKILKYVMSSIEGSTVKMNEMEKLLKVLHNWWVVEMKSKMVWDERWNSWDHLGRLQCENNFSKFN